MAGKKGKSKNSNPRQPPEVEEPQVDSTSHEVDDSASHEVDEVADSWNNIDREEDVAQPGEEKERESHCGKKKRLEVAKNDRVNEVRPVQQVSEEGRSSESSSFRNSLDSNEVRPPQRGATRNPDGNQWDVQPCEARGGVEEENPARERQVFLVETEACLIKGRILSLPYKPGGYPLTACDLRLNSGKISWEVVIDNSVKKSFVTRSVLEMEEKMLRASIPVYGNPPNQFVKLNIRVDDETTILQAPFLVNDTKGITRRRIRFQVAIGKNHLRTWRTRVNLGNHPEYLDSTIALSAMMGRFEIMMHNNYVMSKNTCSNCRSYHSKPIKRILESGVGVSHSCMEENTEAAWDCYEKRFYSLPDMPEMNKCQYCACPLHGGCRPDLSRNSQRPEIAATEDESVDEPIYWDRARNVQNE